MCYGNKKPVKVDGVKLTRKVIVKKLEAIGRQVGENIGFFCLTCHGAQFKGSTGDRHVAYRSPEFDQLSIDGAKKWIIEQIDASRNVTNDGAQAGANNKASSWK